VCSDYAVKAGNSGCIGQANSATLTKLIRRPKISEGNGPCGACSSATFGLATRFLSRQFP